MSIIVPAYWWRAAAQMDSRKAAASAPLEKFRILFEFIVSANHLACFAFAAIGASSDCEDQFWGYDLHSAAFLSSLLLNLLQFFSCDLFQTFFLLQKIVNFGIDGFKPTFLIFGNLSCLVFPSFFSFSLPIRVLPLLCQGCLQPYISFLLLSFWSNSVSAAESVLLLSPHLSNLSPQFQSFLLMSSLATSFWWSKHQRFPFRLRPTSGRWLALWLSEEHIWWFLVVLLQLAPNISIFFRSRKQIFDSFHGGLEDTLSPFATPHKDVPYERWNAWSIAKPPASVQGIGIASR